MSEDEDQKGTVGDSVSFGDTTEMIGEREHALFSILDKFDGWK